jgi:hypothetical protein
MNLFLRKQQEQKFQKDITWLMEPSSDIKWCEPHDHVVAQATRKDINSQKAK